MRFNQIFLELAALKLGVYMPVSYILPSRVSKYEDIYDTEVTGGRGTLKQKDRELSLRSLMTVNLFQRLESLVAAFRLTLGKLQRFHLCTIARIENYCRTGQGGGFSDPSIAFDDAEPDEDVDFLDPEDGL